MNEETPSTNEHGDLIDALMKDAERHTQQRQANLQRASLENAAAAAQLIEGINIYKHNRAYIASVPIPQGRVEVQYSEILRSRQSFDTVISVQLHHVKDGTLPAFEQRLDLNSASGIANLVTSLNGAYGGKKDNYNWTLILNRANNALKKLVVEEKKPTIVTGREYKPSPFLLKPFLQEGVANMVFGNSEVGKTYYALHMAACAAAKKDFLGHETTFFRTLHLDFEDSPDSFTNRLHELSKGLDVPFYTLSENIHYYQPEASIKEESEIVAKMVEEYGYQLLIIDAGADASGGSPNDETKVLEMLNALNNIPCTKLLIHHEPKSIEGVAAENTYYGTAFWRARVRIAWRLTVESQGDEGKVIHAAITKNSNMAPVPPFNYIMNWEPTEPNGPAVLSFTRTDDYVASDEQRIATFLAETGKATTAQIEDATGISRNTLKRKLLSMMDNGQLDRDADKTHTNRVLWSVNITPRK
jgi:hypothetical protein